MSAGRGPGRPPPSQPRSTHGPARAARRRRPRVRPSGTCPPAAVPAGRRRLRRPGRRSGRLPGRRRHPSAGLLPASRGPLVLAGVAQAGVLAGAVGAAFLVTAVFVGSAGDIGREIGAELGPQIGQATAEGLAQGMDEAVGTFEEEFAWGGSGAGLGPVAEFPRSSLARSAPTRFSTTTPPLLRR